MNEHLFILHLESLQAGYKLKFVLMKNFFQKIFKELKRLIFLSLRLAVPLLVFVVTINIYVGHFYSSSIFTNSLDVPPAQTAIVLGASVTAKGKPSPFLTARLEQAIELYRTNKVSKLLFSGDHSSLYYDEVNAMKNYALKYNINPQDIFLDHSGLRTLDSIIRAKKIFGISDAIIVTQKFHLSRALWIAKHFSLPAYGFVADPSYRKIKYTNYLREFAARVMTFFDLYILHSSARYMGKEIPITGNGQDTWDKAE